jgi:beta-mannosidase
MSSPGEVRRISPAARSVVVDGTDVAHLSGWELTHADDARRWSVSLPGTVSDAIGAASELDVDDGPWEFRTVLDVAPAGAGERLWLSFGGIATLSEVVLNGQPVHVGSSMFTAVRFDVTDLVGGEDELLVRCLPLAPALHRPDRRRARWRTSLADNSLRHVRTSLLGRAPGYAPGPPAVGPWRPVQLVRERALGVDELRVRSGVDGGDGVLDVAVDLRLLDDARLVSVHAELHGPTGVHEAELAIDGAAAGGRLRVRDVARWWPHTHGVPHLYELRFRVVTSAGVHRVQAGAVGFRTLTAPDDRERDGLALAINGLPVFVRGAVWTSRVHGGDDGIDRLTWLRDAGLNMVRVPGIGVYETGRFHDACDRLGLLVWQDLMLANFDYPFDSADFRTEVEQETVDVLAGLAGRPSTAVVCGGSEVEQQAGMVGVAYPRQPFLDDTLPALVVAAGSDAICLPATPWGGDLPFRTDRGVAHYYGVGGYRRPFTDVRLAGVRFASECLALSNAPDEQGVSAVQPGVSLDELLDGPAWRAGVPRDRGSTWDFENVRDHYLEQLYGVDVAALRTRDPRRYLDLARATSGRVMAEVFGEWRRAASPCAGGLVLWSSDLVPGAGWGVLDAAGRPKPAWYALRRALAPVAIWLTDEGLNGMDVHVANDGPSALTATVSVTLHRRGGTIVHAARRTVEVPAHGSWTAGVEAMLGRFVDVSYAYRFGAQEVDLVAACLQERSDGLAPAVATRVVGCWPSEPESAQELGLQAQLGVEDAGRVLTLQAQRFVHGVHLEAAGLRAEDSWFDLVPGGAHTVRLEGLRAGDGAVVEVRAVNLDGAVTVTSLG